MELVQMFLGPAAGLIVILVLLLAAWWVIARVIAWLATPHLRETGRRYVEGRCMNCGYDIRVNPNGRCPECGKFM